MVRSITVYLCLVLSTCYAHYSVPNITLVALKPKGLIVYIPDAPGLQRFTFQGKVNEKVSNTETGAFGGDVSKPSNGFWLYREPNLQLKVGDVIHYWFLIQNKRLGYRKDDLYFEVKELEPDKVPECKKSETIVNGGEYNCEGGVVLEDLFHSLDREKWVVEKFIPLNGPNYEFNTYETDTVSVTNSNLVIKPVAKQTDTEIRGTLDLKEGCTSLYSENECSFTHQTFKLLPPVKSGRITSKLTFKYGKIEVRAKLPAGDWLFTEVALVPKDKTNRKTKILIAYARGNQNLQAADGSEIGARLLYCGPIRDSAELKRDEHLWKRKENVPYTSDYHIYTLLWIRNEIVCSVDDVELGRIDTTAFPELNTEFHISLGIGVGGINDFPKDLKSGQNTKPWMNRDTKQIKTFFDARALWSPTWKDEALKVDYVKIHAV